jgi:hypothetical protein
MGGHPYWYVVPYESDIDAALQKRPYGTHEDPHMGVSPLAETDRISFFGDARPGKEAVENSEALWDRLERGTAVYLVLYANGEPHEIFFAGISFD